MIENITIQYAEDLFWHPPQGFGNARDLDIGEGMVFGKDTVEDEEEIEWYEPKCNDPCPQLFLPCPLDLLYICSFYF
jgi:hypothetical protein